MSIITSYDNGKHSPPRGSANRCSGPDCGGEIVRHSLGCGMAVGRCTRCFARYELTRGGEVLSSRSSGLRRFLHEIVTWREED
jgi:hypothetical protein